MGAAPEGPARAEDPGAPGSGMARYGPSIATASWRIRSARLRNAVPWNVSAVYPAQEAKDVKP
eukprot:4799532-Lingulodinium_polyedra.AAC.1